MRGDVTRPADVEAAVNGVDAIYHLAAAVGVGQSMYQVRHYVNTNSMGGATVLEAVIRHRRHIKKVIVASSMSIYGEGLYHCSRCGPISPPNRTMARRGRKHWDIHCSACGTILEPRPTPETKPLNPTSVYAVTKRDHEENFLAIASAYRIPTVALRFFNIYGPLQSLSNPYTGVAAIFSSRLMNRQPPIIFGRRPAEPGTLCSRFGRRPGMRAVIDGSQGRLPGLQCRHGTPNERATTGAAARRALEDRSEAQSVEQVSRWRYPLLLRRYFTDRNPGRLQTPSITRTGRA